MINRFIFIFNFFIVTTVNLFSQDFSLNAYHLGEIIQNIDQMLETEEELNVTTRYFVGVEGLFDIKNKDISYFKNKIEFITAENIKNNDIQDLMLIVKIKDKKIENDTLKLLLNFQTSREKDQILGTYIVHFTSKSDGIYPSHKQIYYSKFSVD